MLIIGFGRFGQVMSQSLLARDVDVTIIDTDIEMIRSAEEFGFKIYYGDGTRLDVLHASGADQRARDRGVHRRPGRGQQDRASWSGPSSRRHGCWCAPTTASIRWS